MNIQINEVHSKKDMKKLIHFPWKIYDEDKTWAPPLKIAVKDQFSPKHPFFEVGTMKSFMALQNGVEKGRIVAIVNRAYNDFYKENTGFFGFFEATPDPEVSKALFDKVEEYFKSLGMNKIIGPMNPSTNYECGLLIDGFDDPPQIMMTYNPPFYKKLIEDNGYKKCKDLLAYKIGEDFKLPERFIKISERAQSRSKITFRRVVKKDWDLEIERMWGIYNSAWEDNWGFVPMTKKEFDHMGSDLKPVVNPDLVLFVEVAGKPAGFIVCLPDYNQVMKNIPSGKLFPTGIFKLLNPKKYVTRCRVITMGVKEEYRHLGLAAIMYQKIHEEIVKAGYLETEMSWILEDNLKMNKPLINMGAKPYKKYRIFEKTI